MNEPKHKIRDVICSANGEPNLLISDVHISPTSGQIIYECITLERRPSYPLFREEDLPEEKDIPF